jgi:Ca-activated chloride channel family protein
MVCESKLENVKKSLHFLLDFLGPKDSISIITFSNVARTVVNRVAVSAIEKENIRARISLIAYENNTNLSAGLIEAYNSLDSNTGIGQGTDVKQGILLLTDGIANMGLLNSSEILDIIRVITSKYSGTSISSSVDFSSASKASLEVSSVNSSLFLVL